MRFARQTLGATNELARQLDRAAFALVDEFGHLPQVEEMRLFSAYGALLLPGAGPAFSPEPSAVG